MKVNEQCAGCLWRRQQALTDDPEYLTEIREILDTRRETDCSPYLIYRFNQVYERFFGKRPSYAAVKKQYNDLLLCREEEIRQRIEASPDPLLTSFLYARIGNYIDFGALDRVEEEAFFALFDKAGLTEEEQPVYAGFLERCRRGKRFLLIADNCGEIVLDKLFLEQLKKAFPQLELTVLVRGGEALNDVTVQDAVYVGIDRAARVVESGEAISGTVPELLSEEAAHALCTADVIFAKGQGNYESLSGRGWTVYYSFLCKCDLFTANFQVPKLTGIFLLEG